MSENSGVARLVLAREGDLSQSVELEYFTQALTAQPGSDYEAAAGVLRFAPGDDFKLIDVPILDDARIERDDERFRIILTNISANATITSSSVDVYIGDDDNGVNLSGNVEVREDQGEAVLAVSRCCGYAGGMSVSYRTQAGTAIENEDFLPVSGALTFEAGEYEKSIRIPIVNDGIAEPRESFSVYLESPSAGASVGSGRVSTVTIVDNDFGFGFECPPDNPNCGFVREDAGFAEVDLIISGDFEVTTPVSVEVFSGSGSALSGIDFEPLDETVTFMPGERRKRLRIPIINDDLSESSESFPLRLRNWVGLGVRVQAHVINIEDNDRGYSLPERIVVRETSGDVLVPILREGDFSFSSSVHFRVDSDDPLNNATAALPGKDYTASEGMVTFGPNETNKLVTIHLLDDQEIEGRKYVNLYLLTPSAGVRIYDGYRRVEIEDNEANPVHVDASFQPEVPYSSLESAAGSSGELGIAVLPDGRIIMSTPLDRLSGENGLGIVRLLRDGSLDAAFKMATISAGTALAVQTNGQVLIGHKPGFVVNGVAAGSLARLNADGSLDRDFQPKLAGRTVLALACQPDGKILVGGHNFFVRLSPGGALDDSFQRPEIEGDVNRVRLDSRDRILIGGVSSVNRKSTVGLARLRSDGSLDESFAAGNTEYDWVDGFEPEPGGTILVRGQKTRDDGATLLGIVSRLSDAGLTDPSFNSEIAGCVYFSPVSENNKILAITRNGDDYSTDSGLVHRLNSDGSNDDSFTTGTFTISYPSSGGWGGDYLVTPDTGGDLLFGGRWGRSLAVNGQDEPGPVRLQMNAPSPRLEVHPDSAHMIETNGIVNVRVLRTGSTARAWSAQWKTTDRGTAQPGIDFVAGAGELAFGEGEVEAIIPIQLIDNDHLDTDRELILAVTGPDGLLPNLYVKILNDEPGFLSVRYFPTGRVQLGITGVLPLGFQQSTDLTEWTNWGWGQVYTPEVILEPLPTGGPRQFYRLAPRYP